MENDDWLRDTRGMYEIFNGDPSPFYKDATLYSGQNVSAGLISSLQALGYDFIFVNFTNGAGDIITNAFWFASFLSNVINSSTYRDNQTEENVVIGPSMGGLITRLALLNIENDNKDHYVREWISFDAPNTGAYVPIGVQFGMYYLYQRILEYPKFSADQKAVIEPKINILNTTAARQMLLRHYSTMGYSEWNIVSNFNKWESNSPQIQPCTEFSDLYDDILTSTAYPKFCRRIAISNGGKGENSLLYSDAVTTQTLNFQKSVKLEIPETRLVNVSLAGYQILSISSPNITIASLPLASNGYRTKTGRYKLFGGSLNDFEPVSTGDDYDLYASDIGCFDNAPGGWYYANHTINANDENEEQPDKYQIQNRWATFMVSASALGLPVTAENIHKNWEELYRDYKSQIPFDDVYGMPGENEQHVRVSGATADKMKWFLEDDDVNNIVRPRHKYRSDLNESISGSLRLKGIKTITIGGSIDGLSTYTLKSGADVNMNAASSVKFLPGAKALKGSKLKVKVGSIAIQKSAIVTENTKQATYSLSSPYIGRVASYEDDEVSNPVNTRSLLAQAEIQIYPNPFSEQLNIVLPNAGNSIVTIINSLGLQVFSKKFNESSNISINLAELPTGLYHVKVINGSSSISSKLLKSK